VPRLRADERRGHASGIPSVGALTWGTQVCQFYDGREDLVDCLVPYFKTGLEHDEYCLWVTADPLTVEEAQARLRTAVPDLATRAQRGQIEFADVESASVKETKEELSRLNEELERRVRERTEELQRALAIRESRR